MNCRPRSIKIDSLGYASDGTNMWDWSDDRLIDLLDSCWFAELADLAKKILKHRKERLLKLDI